MSFPVERLTRWIVSFEREGRVRPDTVLVDEDGLPELLELARAAPPPRGAGPPTFMGARLKPVGRGLVE